MLLQRSFLILTDSLSGGHFLAELLLLLFVITASYLRGCSQRNEKASNKLLVDLNGARAAETRCSHNALLRAVQKAYATCKVTCLAFPRPASSKLKLGISLLSALDKIP